MKKKLLLFFCGLVLFTVILNAQTAESEQPKHRHWLSSSLGLGLMGPYWAWYAAELRYEYMLNPFFSVGAHVYYEASYGIGITGRWYPFAKSFFLGLGFGYNKVYRNNCEINPITNQKVDTIDDYNGIDIIPGLGWRIDVGKPGGLYITPSVKISTIMRWYKNPYTPDPIILQNGLIGYIGLGYAF
jgi:hypothetical protein